MANKNQNETHHLATVKWYGTDDLADTPFVEVLAGHSEAALYRQCRVWAHLTLADDARFEVTYFGISEAPLFLENDPRRCIPIDTRHSMTPRQRAAFDEAVRQLGIQDGDYARDDAWRPKRQG